MGISEIGAKYDAEYYRDPHGWEDLLPASGEALRRAPFPGSTELNSRSVWDLDRPAGILISKATDTPELLVLAEHESNFVLHVEWRVHQRFPGEQGYSGILFRTEPDGAHWHSIQFGNEKAGYLAGRTRAAGREYDFVQRNEMEKARVLPAGWWNSYELFCQGGDLRGWANDGWTTGLENCEIPSGRIALCAQPVEVEYRQLKLKRT